LPLKIDIPEEAEMDAAYEPEIIAIYLLQNGSYHSHSNTTLPLSTHTKSQVFNQLAINMEAGQASNLDPAHSVGGYSSTKLALGKLRVLGFGGDATGSEDACHRSSRKAEEPHG
jgi:hypothetical protein